jgi:hypothetical protein
MQWMQLVKNFNFRVIIYGFHGSSIHTGHTTVGAGKFVSTNLSIGYKFQSILPVISAYLLIFCMATLSINYSLASSLHRVNQLL